MHMVLKNHEIVESPRDFIADHLYGHPFNGGIFVKTLPKPLFDDLFRDSELNASVRCSIKRIIFQLYDGKIDILFDHKTESFKKPLYEWTLPVIDAILKNYKSHDITYDIQCSYASSNIDEYTVILNHSIMIDVVDCKKTEYDYNLEYIKSQTRYYTRITKVLAINYKTGIIYEINLSNG